MAADPNAKLGDWFSDLRGPLQRFLRLRRWVPSAEVEDVAQETFARLLRYERADLVSDPKAYLFKVAQNVACEWSERASRRRPHDSAWLRDLRGGSEPEETFERAAQEQRLHTALETLPARAREVLRLHFSEELTHESIARQMGLSRRMVKREIIRAYMILRSLLDQEQLSRPRGTQRRVEK